MSSIYGEALARKSPTPQKRREMLLTVGELIKGILTEAID